MNGTVLPVAIPTDNGEAVPDKVVFDQPVEELVPLMLKAADITMVVRLPQVIGPDEWSRRDQQLVWATKVSAPGCFNSSL